MHNAVSLKIIKQNPTSVKDIIKNCKKLFILNDTWQTIVGNNCVTRIN